MGMSDDLLLDGEIAQQSAGTAACISAESHPWEG